ncbi:MAG: hypothetical protein JXK05_14410 [Campylobacterales bacterium]|nr:hypothetical protein [Campylobacterales bacterium]
MNRVSLFLSAAALAFLTACGGGGSSGGSNTASSSSAPVNGSTSSQASSIQSVSSSSAQGTQSSSSSLTAQASTLAAAGMLVDSEFISGMLGIANAFSNTGFASNLRAAQTIPCQSGTMNYDITTGGPNITFNQCVNDGTTINGTMSSSNFNASANGYSGTYTFSNFTIDDTETHTFMNLSMQTNVQLSGTTLTSYDVTMNGRMEATEEGQMSRLTFTDYRAVMTNNSVSISGTFELYRDPEVCNANGTYTITTVTPITYNTNGEVTGGALNINGTVYTFNANQTVTVNGQTYDLEELESTCSA